jgi:hypothetical protein
MVTAAAMAFSLPGSVLAEKNNADKWPTQILPNAEKYIECVAVEQPTERQPAERTDPLTLESKEKMRSGPTDGGEIDPEDISALQEVLKAGDIARIREFLEANPAIARATLHDEGLTSKAINLAVGLVPQGPERIDIFRLIVGMGSDGPFVARRGDESNAMGYATYTTVAYPDRSTTEELDFLLSAGADPDIGACVPREPPLLRLCKRYFDPEGSGLNRKSAMERIELFIKHGADPSAETYITTPVEVNGTTYKPKSAEQLARWSESKELLSALKLE